MAEIKNNFLQSKMNKDLDDRLIPNGQYRDALNIQVGKSEQDDIGTLQNSFGNYKLPIPTDDQALVCIGFYMDNQTNRIYRFLTDYEDPNPAQITLPEANSEYTMKITVYDLNAQTYKTLVEGLFLNFSTNKEYQITGVNLIEELLFWTDNRNQPRKINVNLANPNNLVNPVYYTTEEQISVAKYAPIEPISLIRKVVTIVTDVISANVIELDSVVGIVPGMTIVSDDVNIEDYMTVVSVDDILSTVTLYADTVLIGIGNTLTFLISTMSNKSDDPTWPGDPDFIENKFIRFSYRLRYDDNEYSLMAPFTQATYIPKQKGYFINGDETNAYQSTIVRWMENNVNNIELLIPLPDLGTRIVGSYKVMELDILYKESDSNAIKVLDTIAVDTIQLVSVDTNIFPYQYQSQKPYKSLSEEQTVRVYDVVPTRALSQESSGNRVMYGNYYTTYTAPEYINYNTTVSPKSKVNTNFVEYPNHTLKQNRNYQVGFILADKFGRQSPVILSSIDLTTVESETVPSSFGGSTVYAPYLSSIDDYPARDWPGDALFTIVNSAITSTRNIPNGTPGLYAEPIVNPDGNGIVIVGSVITDTTYVYNQYPPVGPTPPRSIEPEIGMAMRGQYTDYVEITNVSYNPIGLTWTLTTSGRVNDIYTYNPDNDPDVKFLYTINPIGWYSYKIVVKQQEHDYYNAYLPGMLNAYPLHQTTGSQVSYVGGPAELENGINTTDFPTNEIDRTAHVVLINDNINKIPRDLAEVGPDQKQYRSSVELFGRVENTSSIAISFVTNGATNNDIVISYDDAIYPDLINQVSPGDGLYWSGGLGSTADDPWYANTVVVSIIAGTITINTRNSISSGQTLNIIKGSNIQYYPTRKADIVTSIANARDFDFLQNSVDNIHGTAGLNFYQLQTNSLIGRISTTNRIGVEGDFMVPYLSVYETKADESLLDLFWETTSTGLISDLNYDVVNGFDGPVSLNNFDFLFFEWQNKNGSSIITGAAGSKYITDLIYPLNNSGIQVLPTDAQLVWVFSIGDNTSPVTDQFGLEEYSPGEYRIYIKDNFEFTHTSPTKNTYSFKVQFEYDNVWYPYEFLIPLLNNEPEPEFSPGDYDRVIDNAYTVIETISAYNGSFLNNRNGLLWEITDGNEGNYFSIANNTGVLSLTNPAIPVGVYNLIIDVTDAVSFATPEPIQLITPGDVDQSSKTTQIEAIITVQAPPLNEGLRDYDSGRFVWQNAVPTPTPTPSGNRMWRTNRLPYPCGYGAVYIGANPLTTVPTVTPDINDPLTWVYGRLPVSPSTGGFGSPWYGGGQKYQTVVNVAAENSFPLTALTQGSIRWTINLNGFKNSNDIMYDWQFQKTHASFILYYRRTPNAPWQLANGINAQPAMTDNNYDFSDYNYDETKGIGWPGGNKWQQQSMAGRVWGNALAVGKSGNPFSITRTRMPFDYINLTTVSPLLLTYDAAPDVFFQKGLDTYNFSVAPNNISENKIQNVQSLGGSSYLATFNSDDYLRTMGDRGLYFYLNPTWQVSSDGGLYTTILPNTGKWEGNANCKIKRSTSFVTSVPGEYCLLVRMVDTSTAVYRDGDGIGPYLSVEIEDANFTYPGGIQTRNSYEYEFRINDAGGLPSGVPSDEFDARDWDFEVNCMVNLDQTVLTEIQLTPDSFNDFLPRLICSGMVLSDNAKVTGCEVAGVDYANYTITISPGAASALNEDETFKLVPSVGDSTEVYADTNQGTEVRQFYTDSNMEIKWEPPIPNKYYTFRNRDRDYQIGTSETDTMPDVTNKPNFCAKFDATGKVVLQNAIYSGTEPGSTEPAALGRLPHFQPNVMTGWFNNADIDQMNNYHENISQVIITNP